jgi:hypothetical protein
VSKINSKGTGFIASPHTLHTKGNLHTFLWCSLFRRVESNPLDFRNTEAEEAAETAFPSQRRKQEKRIK